jgi:hypothetical protein
LGAAVYDAGGLAFDAHARRSGRIVNIASVGGVVGVRFDSSAGGGTGRRRNNADVDRAGLDAHGSPDHALFLGRNRAEYAWFTLSDANPLLSVSVEGAARRILRALRRGESQAVIGPTAQAAKTVNALFPESTATLLRIATVLLPALDGSEGAGSTGTQSHSASTQNPLTLLNRTAMRKANQLPSERHE